MSTLTTHVLDTTLGTPAEGIPVTLFRDDMVIGSGVTDSDGRVRDLLVATSLSAGNYRLMFYVAGYFASAQRESFYDEISIDFRVRGNVDHYHVPLLLSPFGYSTYRGS